MLDTSTHAPNDDPRETSIRDDNLRLIFAGVILDELEARLQAVRQGAWTLAFIVLSIFSALVVRFAFLDPLTEEVSVTSLMNFDGSLAFMLTLATLAGAILVALSPVVWTMLAVERRRIQAMIADQQALMKRYNRPV